MQLFRQPVKNGLRYSEICRYSEIRLYSEICLYFKIFPYCAISTLQVSSMWPSRYMENLSIG